jgi:serine/threonine protein kinase
MWSIGVLIYIMLTGKMPFVGSDFDEIFSKIRGANFSLEDEEFNNISDEAKDLIKKLIVVNQNDRLSADDAKNHIWFKKFKTFDHSLQTDLLDENLV